MERVMLNLAESCVERGYQVDLVLCQAKGPYRNQVAEGVRVIELKTGSTGWLARAYILAADPQGFMALLRSVLLPLKTSKRFRHLPALSRYLRRERPDVLLSAMTHVNLMALWARRLAGVATRIVVSEHITNFRTTKAEPKKKRWHWRFLPPVIQRAYLRADAIVAVSAGVADDLSLFTGIPRKSITTIYNPIVTPRVAMQGPGSTRAPLVYTRRSAGCAWSWAAQSTKGLPPLVRAFARARAVREMRLMILGGRQDERKEASLSSIADACSPNSASRMT